MNKNSNFLFLSRLHKVPSLQWFSMPFYDLGFTISLLGGYQPSGLQDFELRPSKASGWPKVTWSMGGATVLSTPVLYALHLPPPRPKGNFHSRSPEIHSPSPTTCCCLVPLRPLLLGLSSCGPQPTVFDESMPLNNEPSGTPYECTQIHLPNITAIRSSSTSAQSIASDASQPVGAPTEKQSPEKGPDGARKQPTDKMYRPPSLGRPGLTLALPIHPPSVHSRQHLHLLISAEASLAWRPHQAQALPQALEPGQHRQRTPFPGVPVVTDQGQALGKPPPISGTSH